MGHRLGIIDDEGRLTEREMTLEQSVEVLEGLVSPERAVLEPGEPEDTLSAAEAYDRLLDRLR